jgi:pilus assembly protein Flp/PilA
MLKLYVKTAETLRSLRADQKGVVSFEYIIVAASIIATVAFVFTAGGNNTISTALGTGVSAISTALSTATTP